MTKFELASEELRSKQQRWLVTGAAGFIGSHLVDFLLEHGQKVVGVDNLTGGRISNLKGALEGGHSGQFEFVEGDLRDLKLCQRVCSGQDYVLHQAGLGSVPHSMEQPCESHAANVTGTVHLFTAAKDSGVKRVVFASSSSVYGSDDRLPKVEHSIGTPLSPYAATKAICETYGATFNQCFGLPVIGLRYFNVFGPRQDPNGPYAAVIPLWFDALLAGRRCVINGDGSTSRDFCYVANVVQANILAALCGKDKIGYQAFNIACGGVTSLLELHTRIQALCCQYTEAACRLEPDFRPFRNGDIKHSQADISLARELLGYEPTFDIEQGLAKTASWYFKSGVEGKKAG